MRGMSKIGNKLTKYVMNWLHQWFPQKPESFSTHKLIVRPVGTLSERVCDENSNNKLSVKALIEIWKQSDITMISIALTWISFVRREPKHYSFAQKIV